MPQDRDDERAPGSIRDGPCPVHSTPPAANPPIGPMARARIGRELRRHYAQVLALPIPDHFHALLDELAERAERELPQ